MVARAGASSGQALSSEDLEQLMGVRRYVQTLQSGTAVLLKKDDDMKICKFWVTEDLRVIKWKEHEGGTAEDEVHLSRVLEVQDISQPTATGSDEDGHYALAMFLRELRQSPTRRNAPLELIFSSREDMVAWRDGLQFLIAHTEDSRPATAPASRATAAAKAKAASPQPRSPVTAASLASPASSTSRTAPAAESSAVAAAGVHLAALLQENERLQQMLKQKDATIAELLRDAQQRADGAERSKTSNTSRESDDHLRDREVFILRHKVKQQQKALKAKEQTVNELLRTVARLNADAAGDSSAAEEGEGDHLGDDDDDEEQAPFPQASPGAAAAQATAAGRSARSAAEAEAGAALTEARSAAAVAAGAGFDDDESEITELANKLARLESAVAGIGGPRPLRGGGAAAQAAKQAQVATQAQAATHAAMQAAAAGAAAATIAFSRQAAMNARAAGALRASEGMGAVNGVPAPQAGSGARLGLGQRSLAALEAVAREMTLLDEKKRVVEELAKNLEPPSDNEEDDGFPLR